MADTEIPPAPRLASWMTALLIIAIFGAAVATFLYQQGSDVGSEFNADHVKAALPPKTP